MNIKIGLFTLGLVAAMSGCIDSGGDDADAGSDNGGGGAGTVDRISFSGLVADGYLAGAKVCLDLNNNKECDDDEPSATSGEGGAFEITQATQEQRDTYPLLVEVVVGTTVDEDTITDDAPTGVAFDQPLTLTAPVGYEFISPLTTMVQNEVEGGATASAAETSVQEKLGTTLDLDSDYIAGQTGANSDEYEQLHQVAQVTAIVISDNLVKLEDAAQANDISLDDLISAIVDEVFAALEEITEQVEEIAQNEEQEFDPDSVATEVDEELVDLEPDTIDDVVDLNNAQDNAVEANLAGVIKAGGISWFYTESNNEGFTAEYGTLSIDGSNAFQEVSYDWDGSTFTEDTSVGDGDPGFILINGTWTATTNADEVSDINALEDGSIELVQAEGNFIKRFKGTEVDLANNNARILMNALDDGEGLWGEYLSADLVFPAGSKGYTLQDNGSDEPYIFESWSDCEVDQLVGGLCSFAYVQDGPGQTGGAVATLADIKVATAAQVAGSASTALPVLKAVEIGYGDNDKLWAEIVEGGAVNYYVVAHDHQSYSFLGASTWAAVSGAESTTIELQAIAGIHHFDSEFDDGGNPVLAVIDGFVRNAAHELNSTEVSNVVQLLNDTARDAVTGVAFSLDNLALRFTEPCTDGNTVWDGSTDVASIEAQWGLASDFNAAVISCLAGNPEEDYVESEMKDIVVKNLHNDVKVTYLANNKGVISSAEGQTWFDWSVNGDARLVLNYINSINEPETLTIARLVKDLEQAYVQSKSFLENANINAGLAANALPSRGLISVNAFDLLPLDPVDTVLPTILFDASTLAGSYSGTPATGDGGGSFVLNANGSGSVHWEPDAEQLAENDQHPGDDDDLLWSVDDQGRLLLNLFNAQAGEFYGVDRYSLTLGDQSLGVIKGEEINSTGRYQALGNFAWEKTEAATPVTAGFDAATLPGIYAWGINAAEGKGDASFTFMADGTGTSHWPPEPDETNPDHPGYIDDLTWTVDGSGYLIVQEIVDDINIPGYLRYSITSGTYESGEVQAESCADDNMCEVTHTYTWDREPSSTLSELVGVWDDHGYQGGTIDDLYFFEIIDDGDGTGSLVNYDYQTDTVSSQDQDCSIINTLDIVDNGDGTFHATGFEDIADGGAALDIDGIFWSRDGSSLHGSGGTKAVAVSPPGNYNVACP